MANLNSSDKSPLKVLLESVADHAPGSIHINASDSNWSNVDGDRLTVYHGNTPSSGCGEGQPQQTSTPSMEPLLGSANSVDLRRGRFLNIKGADKVFHFQDTVSPEMQLFFQRLAATQAGGVSSTESKEELDFTDASLMPGGDELGQTLVRLLLSASAAPRLRLNLAEQLVSSMVKSTSIVERR